MLLPLSLTIYLLSTVPSIKSKNYLHGSHGIVIPERIVPKRSRGQQLIVNTLSDFKHNNSFKLRLAVIAFIIIEIQSCFETFISSRNNSCLIVVLYLTF